MAKTAAVCTMCGFPPPQKKPGRAALFIKKVDITKVIKKNLNIIMRETDKLMTKSYTEQLDKDEHKKVIDNLKMLNELKELQKLEKLEKEPKKEIK